MSEVFNLAGGGKSVEIVSLQVTQNGVYSAPDGQAYSPIDVNVQSTEVVPLNVTDDGTYTAPQGKAYSPVTVDVPTITLVPITITENGVYTPAELQGYGPVTVKVNRCPRDDIETVFDFAGWAQTDVDWTLSTAATA